MLFQRMLVLKNARAMHAFKSIACSDLLLGPCAWALQLLPRGLHITVRNYVFHDLCGILSGFARQGAMLVESVFLPDAFEEGLGGNQHE